MGWSGDVCLELKNYYFLCCDLLPCICNCRIVACRPCHGCTKAGGVSGGQGGESMRKFEAEGQKSTFYEVFWTKNTKIVENLRIFGILTHFLSYFDEVI